MLNRQLDPLWAVWLIATEYFVSSSLNDVDDIQGIGGFQR